MGQVVEVHTKKSDEWIVGYILKIGPTYIVTCPYPSTHYNPDSAYVFDFDSILHINVWEGSEKKK